MTSACPVVLYQFERLSSMDSAVGVQGSADGAEEAASARCPDKNYMYDTYD